MGPETANDRRTGSTNDRYTPIFEPKVEQMHDEDSIISGGTETILQHLRFMDFYKSFLISTLLTL